MTACLTPVGLPVGNCETELGLLQGARLVPRG